MFTAGWVLFTVVAVWVVPPTIGFLLRKLDASPSPADQRLSVSVIVTACNEAEGIEATLRSLLASQDIDLELIAVNDRSTDSTGPIIDAIAAEDPRLKVVHITERPPEWLGKTNAMHVASQQVTAPLLLFTDGDIVFAPRALVSACDYATKHRLDHLCLLPQFVPGGMLENACLAFFGFMFAIGMQLHLIRTKWPFAYAGVGAFNLVNTECYRRIGGHQPIAMDVLDDVKLGKLMRRSGGRVDCLRAPELLSVRWQRSLRGVITGLEKNAFASLNYSLWLVCLCTVTFLSTMIAPYVVPFFIPWSESSGFLATVALWHITYGSIARLIPGGWKLAPMFPIAACIMAYTWWRSTWITLRRGGVQWRESFYSLKELRNRVYR
jgi:glycosyltransferase involved in cell wall biosynthesis